MLFRSFITFLVLHLCGVTPYNFGEMAMTLSFISIWFSVILVALGIIGEYVGRTLIEAQNRPLYYIEEEIKAE